MTLGVSPCMGPPLQYKLKRAYENARTPQCLLDMLRSEHGSLHDPYPECPTVDGLHTPSPFTQVNFVNTTFVHAREWLLSAAEEANTHKHTIMLRRPSCLLMAVSSPL
jgi:hypothetical protein